MFGAFNSQSEACKFMDWLEPLVTKKYPSDREGMRLSVYTNVLIRNQPNPIFDIAVQLLSRFRNA